MKKSPIDNLFFEIYGFYPTKSGQSFEMLVAAAFKLVFNKDIAYDQRIKGNYSETTYQLDGLVTDREENGMIEAKDYSLDNRKVGRGDLQKLQGALTDLPVSKGMFASSTDYTTPAKKYANSAGQNPMQKSIELFHIRPSTESDEEGRIKKIILNTIMVVPDYVNSKFNPILSEDGVAAAKANDILDKPIDMRLENFVDQNGSVITTLAELTRNYSPSTTWKEDYIAKGCWILTGTYFMHDDVLYGIIGLQYEIKFRFSRKQIVIESDGKPKVYVKSENGIIDKLLTDEDLKTIKFNNGKVEIR